MAGAFQTCKIAVKTDSREVTVDQALIYVTEVNDAMAGTLGVDLVGAAAAGIDSVAARKVAQSIGWLGRGYIKAHNGKYYLILKGLPNMRPVLHGTRYLVANPQVVHITVGAQALAKGAARMTGIGIIAYVGLNIVEEILRDPKDRDFGRLLGNIAADVTKFAIAAGVGFLVALVIIKAGLYVAAGLVVGIVVSVATGVVLEFMDQAYNLTEKMVKVVDKKVDEFSVFASDVYDAAADATRETYNSAVKTATKAHREVKKFGGKLYDVHQDLKKIKFEIDFRFSLP